MADRFVYETEKNRDTDGFPISESKEIEAYFREKSVARTEFYQAHNAGIEIKLILETRKEDYDRTAHKINGRTVYAKKLYYNDELYEIVRTFAKGKGKIELSCR